MQSTYLIILFARHIPHVQLVPGHWTDPQRETARQGESIIAELMLFEENYQNESMLLVLIKYSYWSMVHLTQNNSKGCVRWPPSWSSYWEVGGVGWQIFGERKNQLCSSNVKKKERKSFKTLSKRSQLLPIKVLHFSPSVLVLKYNLVPILFPPCRDPLLQRNQRDPVKK